MALEAANDTSGSLSFWSIFSAGMLPSLWLDPKIEHSAIF
jgi:hypothetical protein